MLRQPPLNLIPGSGGHGARARSRWWLGRSDLGPAYGHRAVTAPVTGPGARGLAARQIAAAESDGLPGHRADSGRPGRLSRSAVRTVKVTVAVTVAACPAAGPGPESRARRGHSVTVLRHAAAQRPVCTGKFESSELCQLLKSAGCPGDQDSDCPAPGRAPGGRPGGGHRDSGWQSDGWAAAGRAAGGQ